MTPPSSPQQPTSESAAVPVDQDRTVAAQQSEATSINGGLPTLLHREDPAPAGAELPTVPGYQILEVLGRGGMGVVYLARQIGLNRLVALKMILAGAHASPEDMVRFVAEGEAVARLQHTNIVQIYQIGRQGDVPFFSLEYIDGGTLAQRLKGVPQQPRDAARLVECLARAMHLAHQKGIIHRDLKPGNILLTLPAKAGCKEGGNTDVAAVPLGACTPKVTDFGLAKRVEGGSGLTQTGLILGTPSYMAPEQAQGKKEVGPAADIYALGALLYEMLTGRPPFRGLTPMETVLHVLSDEPVPPIRLQRGCPRDLDTICLKCLHKDPDRRYATAEALADDLQRFLTDRPILARRTGNAERLWRWCRRNPLVAGLTGAVQLTLLGLLVLAAWSNQRISQALSDTDAQRKAAVDARGEVVTQRDAAIGVTYRALLNETRAQRLAHSAGWRTQALQNLQRLANLETPQRDLAELRSEAIACLGSFDAHEEARFLGHTESVWSLDFSPDGALLATAGYDGRLQLWDVKEHHQVREITDPAVNLAQRHNNLAPLPAVRFRPDGSYLAYATWNQGIGLLDVRETDLKPGGTLKGAAGRYLAFDSKGTLLAVSSGNGTVSLYDAGTQTPKRLIRPGASNASYFPVALSSDGDVLATIGPQNAVQLYTVVDGQESITLGRHRGTVRSLCFSPSARLLASASEDHTVKLWPLSGTEDPITLLGHTARVNCVAFSPDGGLVASASDDHTILLWETRTGQALMVLHPEIGAVLSVAFSPDGNRLAAGGEGRDGAAPVCLFQLTNRQEQRRLAGHGYQVNDMVFHPSRLVLASGSSDRNIILWDLQTGRLQQRWDEKRQNPVQRLAFAPDGELLAVGLGSFSTSSGRDYAIDLRETATGTSRIRLLGPQASIADLAFDPAGKLLAAGTKNGDLFIWNTRTPQPLHQWHNPKSIEAVAFLRDGAEVLTGEIGGRVAIRELANNETVQETVIPGELRGLAVAPDEGRVAVGGTNGTLSILALPGLETRYTQEKAHDGFIMAVAFSSDGRLLATGGNDHRVILWDARTYQRLCTLPQNTDVNRVAFDPTSRQLAICGTENLITVWNLAQVAQELAAIGLDWDASLPKGTLQPDALLNGPSKPVTVVRASRQPVPAEKPASKPVAAPPLVVALPATPQRRAATAEEIADWVRGLDDADEKVRQTAAGALTEVGPPAIDPLKAVAAGAEGTRRRQARIVLDRIAVAEALAPSRVRLKLEDALPAAAIKALAEQSHLSLTYTPPTDGKPPKRISLTADNLTVWEALDRICEAGELGYYSPPNGSVVQIASQATRSRGVHGDTGPFRIQLLTGSYVRNLSVTGNAPRSSESLHLNLGILRESNSSLLSYEYVPRLTEARTADGQSLLTGLAPQPNRRIVTEGNLLLWVSLKPPERRDDSLKVLKGVLSVEVMVRPQDLVTVPNLAEAKGKTFRGEQGHRLAIDAVQKTGQQWFVTFRASGPSNWSYDPSRYGVELIDARGRSTRTPYQGPLTMIPRRTPQSEDLLWLATAPHAPGLSALPWSAPALQGGTQEWYGQIYFYPQVALEGSVKLRFYRFERVQAELPFELHDVPLP